jgi:sec-independent protein translocase protein TatA
MLVKESLMSLLIGMPSGWEWIIVLVAVLLLFGGAKLPQLAKALGQSKRAFKEGLDEGSREEIPAGEKEKERVAR